MIFKNILFRKEDKKLGFIQKMIYLLYLICYIVFYNIILILNKVNNLLIKLKGLFLYLLTTTIILIKHFIAIINLLFHYFKILLKNKVLIQ